MNLNQCPLYYSSKRIEQWVTLRRCDAMALRRYDAMTLRRYDSQNRHCTAHTTQTSGLITRADFRRGGLLAIQHSRIPQRNGGGDEVPFLLLQEIQWHVNPKAGATAPRLVAATGTVYNLDFFSVSERILTCIYNLSRVYMYCLLAEDLVVINLAIVEFVCDFHIKSLPICDIGRAIISRHGLVCFIGRVTRGVLPSTLPTIRLQAVLAIEFVANHVELIGIRFLASSRKN